MTPSKISKRDALAVTSMTKHFRDYKDTKVPDVDGTLWTVPAKFIEERPSFPEYQNILYPARPWDGQVKGGKLYLNIPVVIFEDDSGGGSEGDYITGFKQLKADYFDPLNNVYVIPPNGEPEEHPPYQTNFAKSVHTVYLEVTASPPDGDWSAAGPDENGAAYYEWTGDDDGAPFDPAARISKLEISIHPGQGSLTLPKYVTARANSTFVRLGQISDGVYYRFYSEGGNIRALFGGDSHRCGFGVTTLTNQVGLYSPTSNPYPH